MRIGILTLHDSVNYGALAQAYALRCQLTKMGHEAKVIDRRRDPGMAAVRTPRLPAENYRLFGIFNIRDDNGACEAAVRIDRSVEFLKKQVGLTDYCFSDWQKAPKELGFDCIVVGSDQVWNANNLDPADYLLLRGTAAGISGISYAASIGMHSIPPDQTEVFKQGLSRFQALSVREREAAELLRSLGFDAKCVVDPVLLAGEEIWHEIVAAETVEKGNVFAYFLAEDFDRLFKALGKFATARGKRVDFFADWYALRGAKRLRQCRRNHRHMKALATMGINLHIDAGPEQFVRSIAAADTVVTNSYHALMFALLFKKQVRVVLPTHPVRQAMNARLIEFAQGVVSGKLIHAGIESALAVIGETQRCVTDESELAKRQQESREWLANAICHLKPKK